MNKSDGKVHLTVNDRALLIVESTLVASLTALSAGFYVTGDLSKRLSKRCYNIGATIDTYALELLELTVDSLEKYIWMDYKDG